MWLDDEEDTAELLCCKQTKPLAGIGHDPTKRAPSDLAFGRQNLAVKKLNGTKISRRKLQNYIFLGEEITPTNRRQIRRKLRRWREDEHGTALIQQQLQDLEGLLVTETPHYVGSSGAKKIIRDTQS